MRFLTERDIEKIVSQGVTEIALDDATRVTDLAREAARRLGVRFVRPKDGRAVATPPASAPAPAAHSPLHQQVRAAIVSQLGGSPEGLDEIIARVLKAVGDAG